ncbi:MAG: thermonuclease family protein [Phycisphaerae bacterium]
MAKQTKKNKSGNTRYIGKSPVGLLLAGALLLYAGFYAGAGGLKIAGGEVRFASPFSIPYKSAFTAELSEIKPAKVISKTPVDLFSGSYGRCTVSRIDSVTAGDCFVCDIAGVPEVLGSEIPVRIAGIKTPQMDAVDQYERMKALDAKNLAKRKLLAAEKIELKNIRRSEDFSLTADVYVDGVNLGDTMLESGLADKAD